MENLTICNSMGASEQIKPSEEGFSLPYSASATGGDVVGIKSCTSARTGGGEGCLIKSTCTGVSIGSKEIKEPGSSARGILLSLFCGKVESELAFSSSEMLKSFLINTPSSTGGRRLLSLGRSLHLLNL